MELTDKEIINMIRKGGNERKKALEIIDNDVAVEMAEKAEADLLKSPFKIWNKTVHSNAKQLERIRRSSSVKILMYNSETQIATIQGSGKDAYKTSFNSCTCGDYMINKVPCKHMYKVAADYGNIDFNKYL